MNPYDHPFLAVLRTQLDAGLRSMPITDAKLAASLKAVDRIGSDPYPNLHAFDRWEIEHPSLRLRRLACLMFAVDVRDLRDGVRAAIESVRAARSTMWRERVELMWQAELNLTCIWVDYRAAMRAARREREAA